MFKDLNESIEKILDDLKKRLSIDDQKAQRILALLLNDEVREEIIRKSVYYKRVPNELL